MIAIVIPFRGNVQKELPQFSKRYLHLVTINADPQGQTWKKIEKLEKN